MLLSTLWPQALRLSTVRTGAPALGPRTLSDEHYSLDICDDLLDEKSERQKRFDFLRRLPSRKNGRCTMLSVDAYYPSKALTIEYHETAQSRWC